MAALRFRPMSDILSMTSAQLKRAAKIKDAIAALNEELVKLAGVRVGRPAKADSKPRKKSKLTAAGRAKIAAGQRKRWDKIRAEKKKKG